MRMKRSRLRQITIVNRNVTKDNEGVAMSTYAGSQSFIGEVWAMTSRLQVETYGNRITSMVNARIEGEYEIVRRDGHEEYVFDNFSVKQGDGVCVYSDDITSPDYKIISITPNAFLTMELERV